MLMLDTAMCIIDINNAIREITLTLYPASSGSLADRYNDLTLPWPVENELYAFMVRLWYRYIFRTIHSSRSSQTLEMSSLFGVRGHSTRTLGSVGFS